MTVARGFFFLWMVTVGIGCGALLAIVPVAGNFIVRPYFWPLIAVALFDGATALSGRAPTQALSLPARAVGFVAAMLIMIGIAIATGTSVQWF
ncbi:MAG: hypothetical protein JO237_01075 [Pseudolabrys sp.]|nr:hypothetical protein [Pseudolabrys sp.]